MNIDKVKVAREVLKDLNIDLELFLEEEDEDLIINAMLVYLDKIEQLKKIDK